MDTSARALFAKPEGLLYLFLSAGVSVQFLAFAFETNAQVIEASLREAMRKRDAMSLADASVSAELVTAYRRAG